ncbi:MAG: hypothetical protein GMKNLPBB_00864 [Myxococcota bacterium]|nr:hypothetical protein [Myxococcota bacterium]
MRKSRRWTGMAMAALLLIPAPAFADAINPDESACQGKKAGDSCEGGKSCASATCSRLDYSDGSPPTTKEYACLLCKDPASASDAAAPDNAPAQDVGVKVDASITIDASTGDAGAAKGDSGCGCDLGVRRSGWLSLGSLLTGLALAMGLIRRRAG